LEISDHDGMELLGINEAMLRTFLNTLRWSYQKNAPDLFALLRHQYPDFVLHRRPAPVRGEIPVFVFHSVEPESFKKQLQFLVSNKYRTLSGEEFRAASSGETSVPDRSVLLTFDDGLSSLWTVAFPLLRKYGLQAVSFIIPGCIPEKVPQSSTGVDNGANRLSTNTSPDRERNDFPLCSWEEIREMHEGGVIDFQSHTMYHHRICVSPRLVDFVHPNFSNYYHLNVEVPVYRSNGALDFARQVALGTPVYGFEPRMKGSLQYFDDEALRRICVDYVAGQNGSEFFRRKDWRRQLYSVYRQARTQQNNGEYETPAEQERAIFEDLQKAKRTIEEHLPGKTVNQLCYPWFTGSRVAVEQSKRVGYGVNYWGILLPGKKRRSGDALFYVSRIDEIYLFRLPGEGRKSLREIWTTKIRSNLRKRNDK
jgi:hypothetical protein